MKLKYLTEETFRERHLRVAREEALKFLDEEDTQNVEGVSLEIEEIINNLFPEAKITKEFQREERRDNRTERWTGTYDYLMVWKICDTPNRPENPADDWEDEFGDPGYIEIELIFGPHREGINAVTITYMPGADDGRPVGLRHAVPLYVTKRSWNRLERFTDVLTTAKERYF